MWFAEDCLFKDSDCLNMVGTLCTADSSTPTATATSSMWSGCYANICGRTRRLCFSLFPWMFFPHSCHIAAEMLTQSSNYKNYLKKKFSRASVRFRCNIGDPGKWLLDKEVLSHAKDTGTQCTTQGFFSCLKKPWPLTSALIRDSLQRYGTTTHPFHYCLESTFLQNSTECCSQEARTRVWDPYLRDLRLHPPDHIYTEPPTIWAAGAARNMW